MASPQASQKLMSELFIDSRIHNPTTATTAQVLTDATSLFYLDGSLFSHFCFVTAFVSGSGGIIQVELVAADDVAFATNLVVIKDTGAIDLDAADDRVILECSAEEIAQESADAGANSRYVSLRIDAGHADDIALVTMIAKPRFPRLNLTTATRQA